MNMLERMIPDFETQAHWLSSVGKAGWIMGYGWGIRGIEYVHSTYPDEWQRIYEDRNYFVGDPILLWHMANTGAKRWSEVKAPDLRGVMKEAREFGLHYGAVFSRKTGRKKSFLTVSRSDREITDSEMAMLAEKFKMWTDLVLARASLTEGEIAVLQCLRDGLGQSAIAETLRISEATVKQRAIKACSKLNAKTRTQAVAIAVQRNYFKS